MNKYEGIKTKINRELKNGKISKYEELTLKEIEQSIIYRLLTPKQQLTYQMDLRIYGNVFIEKIDKPSILRKIVCYFKGHNPKYKIIDPHKIRTNEKD